MARTATRERPTYRCGECGVDVARWVGRCPECRAWGSVAETVRTPLRAVTAGPVTAPAVPLHRVARDGARHVPTGIGEVDRVLGGGLVPGAVILLAGEPGVGKSTLLLGVAARFATGGQRVLVVTGEESAAQVRARAGRVDAVHPDVYLAAETDVAAVLGHVGSVRPRLLIVDSVQTVTAGGLDAAPGSVAQVRDVAAALTRVARATSMATILVGHVTKDGAIAGPRALEHLVDVVMFFEGDRGSRLRLLRAVKNRYGAADEVGCFDIGDGGLTPLPDPSGLFLARHPEAVPGTCVTVTVEGRRPLVAEVQALVARSTLAAPRRATSGLDNARLAMILAVLERRAGVRLSDSEVYAATVGGVRIGEPAADLAVAVALASSARDQPVSSGVVAFGEVGLAGELRAVRALDRRLAEAARLGFSRAVVPADADSTAAPIRVTGAVDLAEALSAVTKK